MADLDAYLHTETIPEDRAQQMRLLIAGHATSVDDARELLQAFGLIPDPLTEQWVTRTNRTRHVKEAP